MTAPTIGFCQLPGGPTVAFATAGQGPPLVMLPGWVSHVEKMWSHPAAVTARDKLAAAHRFIWFDRLGCGLSDRDGFSPSVENDVEQLEAVLLAAGVDRCSLIGYSMGGPAAALFAARHPGRVDRLVLYSTYARGWTLSSDAQHESMKALIRSNWALGALTLAALFVPNGSRRDLNWFSRFQRDAATAETAVLLFDAVRTHDARRALTAVRSPTLVLTNRHDGAVDPENSREVSALVRGATLQVLEGNEHEPFIRDSGSVAEAILGFVDGRPPTGPVPEAAPAAQTLSRRETEVLTLLAEGQPNKVIAQRLGIGVATVERHVASVYRKVGARGRADAALHAASLGLVPLPAPA
jgi:pimeloyl-ACP methyl ester carboxylesterase/DNA-binding CsgD family transcriptional regulator